MNLLDIVPSLDRHLRTYRDEADTDSKLAGYIADAIEALSWYWGRTYSIEHINPYTYIVTPDIATRDKRAIVLMASIIYKMGNVNLAGFTDGDFSYNPFPRGKDTSSLSIDINELDKMLPKARLASPSTMAMRGFNNIWNPEGYNYAGVFWLLG